MKAGYDDILELTGRKPLWWDENGVPRFRPHHPGLSPCIYARECVLLRIACQACGCQQLVQMTMSSMDVIRAQIHAEWSALSRGEPKPDFSKAPTLADEVRDGSIHYGDPPHHNDETGEFCHGGCTMNCVDLAVVEFWKHETEWKRVAELERALPPT